MYLSIFRKTR